MIKCSVIKCFINSGEPCAVASMEKLRAAGVQFDAVATSGPSILEVDGYMSVGPTAFEEMVETLCGEIKMCQYCKGTGTLGPHHDLFVCAFCCGKGIKKGTKVEKVKVETYGEVYRELDI